MLERARQSVARWLGLVDRLPPAEVLELVLDETAYMFETRGARVRQARENLKKIRAMIRRVQNRGYATMSRLAEHLERLTAGDESNAVIDAGDSVSLMTIHAAKGLEFPVVFVVNLSRGTGGRRHAIRVVSDARHGEAWLSVGDFQSEADADAKAKDREETKRLLYVALTRARDRLYLASEVKDARWRAFGGSLGDILPPGVKARFEAASMSPAPETTEWTAASGHVHTFRVCTAASIDELYDAETRSQRFLTDICVETRRPASRCYRRQFRAADRSVRAPACCGHEGACAGSGEAAPQSDRDRQPQPHRHARAPFVRTLRHVACRRRRHAQPIADELARLIRDDETVEAGDVEQVFSQARSAYLALCGQRTLSQALESGDALFEVPFSVRPASSQMILRGTFDCLIQRRDGGMTVLELKTGKPAPEHEQQLEMYLIAARAMFPGTPVEGKFVYARRQLKPDARHGESGRSATRREALTSFSSCFSPIPSTVLQTCGRFRDRGATRISAARRSWRG